jgi:flavorubredoxin
MAPITVRPERIAPDAWLVTELFPGAPGAHVPVRSLVLTGEQPVVVDTGTSLNRHAWSEAVWSIVDPRDVRWVFLSHDDHDHVGNLTEALVQCPQATLVANWFSAERLAGDLPLPRHRMRWVDDGDALDVGDRVLRAVRPPVFDSPTTRGLYDPHSGVYWASDAFASMVTPGVLDAADLDAELWEQTFLEMNCQISPWHHLLDEAKYAAELRRTADLGATTVVGAHGAVLRGRHLARAYELLHLLPGRPAVRFPSHDVLEALLASGDAPAGPERVAAVA